MDAKTLKGLVKTLPQINEDMLDDFLKSRGVDPKYVSMQTKVSHAKSGEFKKWANPFSLPKPRKAST